MGENRFCIRCGARLLPNDNYCTNCGASNGDIPNGARGQNPSSSQSGMKAAVFIAIAAAVIVVIVAVFAVIQNTPSSPDDGSSSKAAVESGSSPAASDGAGSGEAGSRESSSTHDDKNAADSHSDSASASSDAAATVPDDAVPSSDAGKGIVSTRTKPFWGVWTTAGKKRSTMEEALSEVDPRYRSDALVLVSNEWENLNQEPWYVLSLGAFTAEDDAQARLEEVKSEYPDAYVKHTGSKKA